MIPKPPFPGDFSPERELAEFRRLQPRLHELWNALAGHEEQAYTSVVVPSLTLDQRELEKLEGASYLIGAVSQFGKLGLTVIGNTHEQVDELFDNAISVLDRETSYVRTGIARLSEGGEKDADADEESSGARHTIDMVRLPDR